MAQRRAARLAASCLGAAGVGARHAELGPAVVRLDDDDVADGDVRGHGLAPLDLDDLALDGHCSDCSSWHWAEQQPAAGAARGKGEQVGLHAVLARLVARRGCGGRRVSSNDSRSCCASLLWLIPTNQKTEKGRCTDLYPDA